MSRTGLVILNTAVIGLAIAAFFALGSVQPLYPYTGLVIHDRTPVFEWSGWDDSYELLIDDDPGFSTPMQFSVEGRSFSPSKELDFGTYWWKVRSGEKESEPRKFTIASKVQLSRQGPYTIANTGNTDLLVHGNSLTGEFVLGIGDSADIGEGDDVKAEQA